MNEDFPEPEIDNSTVYRGRLEGEGDQNVIYRVQGEAEETEELEPLSNISPGATDSFDWGFGGRAPLTTALTILDDAYDTSTARENARDFMENYIAQHLNPSYGRNLKVDEIPYYLEKEE